MIKSSKIVTLFIAVVWIVNGLFCKILKMVPRHELIVARILKSEHADLITIFIGFLEILMAIWILNGYKSRWNAIVQIVIIALMNLLEFILAPDLLLWGKLNIVFAFSFVLLIYYNEFHLKKNTSIQTYAE